MTVTSKAAKALADGTLAWLFPATYAVHIGEEYLGGFPRWFSRTFDARLKNPGFIAINAVGFTLISVAALGARASPELRGLLPALATAVMVNGSLHVILSVLTRSYSPGAVSGLVLWIPLGALTLHACWSVLPRRSFWTGILAGLALQAAAFLAATRGGLQ